MLTKTKITVVAVVLLSSVSGAFASEAFDVNIYRPAVTQGQDAYAQAPRSHVERRQSTQQYSPATSQDRALENSYWGHGSQID